MPPLNPDDYAIGRTLERDGQRVVVHETFKAPSGNQYLAVAPPDNPVMGLVGVDSVRDNDGDKWSSITQETLDEEARQASASQEEAPPADATGAPDATGSGASDPTPQTT
jgi:hypothetical protein